MYTKIGKERVIDRTGNSGKTIQRRNRNDICQIKVFKVRSNLVTSTELNCCIKEAVDLQAD